MPGQRSAERVRIDAFVKIHGEEGQELVFRTRDLSEQGLFLFTPVTQAYPIKVGSTLAIELADVTFKVVVVRVVMPNTAEAELFPTGFGVRILEISDEARAVVRALVASATSAS